MKPRMRCVPDRQAGPERPHRVDRRPSEVYVAVMQASVTVHIAAPPQQVWELISDITRMGEYSPEVFETEWLEDATGPAVGTRYRGHVKRNERGPTYWTTCEVTQCVPGEIFEFAVMMGSRPVNTWRYEFAPGPGGGTDVTESFRLTGRVVPAIWYVLGGFLRQRRNERDMRRTLERVKAVAETAPPG